MTRDEAYSVLSDLVFKGFLAYETQVSGHRFIFKTINENEFNLIRILSGDPNDDKMRIVFNIYLLMFSTVSVDGIWLLGENKDRNSNLFSLFWGLPWHVCNELIRKTNRIRGESYEALNFLEGFSYTEESRRIWKILGGRDPTADSFTGMIGTSRMGLNYHQQTWSYINGTLDEEEEYNNQFNFSLLIASASNPKGVRQIRNKHDSTMNHLLDRRKRLAQEGRVDKRDWSEEGWAASTDTVEELVSELERQMTGKKDRHDKFIDGYLKKMKDKAEQRAQEARERILKAREGMEDVLISGKQEMVSPEEMERVLQKRRRTTVSVADEEQAKTEDRDRFVKKVSGRVLTARK